MLRSGASFPYTRRRERKKRAAYPASRSSRAAGAPLKGDGIPRQVTRELNGRKLWVPKQLIPTPIPSNHRGQIKQKRNEWKRQVAMIPSQSGRGGRAPEAVFGPYSRDPNYKTKGLRMGMIHWLICKAPREALFVLRTPELFIGDRCFGVIRYHSPWLVNVYRIGTCVLCGLANLVLFAAAALKAVCAVLVVYGTRVGLRVLTPFAYLSFQLTS